MIRPRASCQDAPEDATVRNLRVFAAGDRVGAVESGRQRRVERRRLRATPESRVSILHNHLSETEVSVFAMRGHNQIIHPQCTTMLVRKSSFSSVKKLQCHH